MGAWSGKGRLYDPGPTWFWIIDKILAVAVAIRDRRDRNPRVM
jgi:hypothetical protein